MRIARKRNGRTGWSRLAFEIRWDCASWQVFRALLLNQCAYDDRALQPRQNPVNSTLASLINLSLSLSLSAVGEEFMQEINSQFRELQRQEVTTCPL